MRASLLATLKQVRLRRIQVLSSKQGRSLNTFIGRTAHVALLDSEEFARKFVSCTAHYLDPIDGRHCSTAHNLERTLPGPH